MYSQEFIDFLVHFHGDRDYFECHEILEEYWKKVDKKNKDSILVGFILLAVSAYHHRRNNFPGASHTLKKALSLFSKQKKELSAYGFEPASFISFIKEQLNEIDGQTYYASKNLPIHDPELIHICQQACAEKGLTWGKPSDLSNENIVHKHIKRDRSMVVQERNQALLKRHESRE